MNITKMIASLAIAATCACCLARDMPISGGKLVTDMNAGGHSITNLATPTRPFDAATKKYVDEHGGGSGGVDTNAVKALIESETGGTNTLLHTDFPMSAAWTNGVAAVVTNDVGGFTEWTVGNIVETSYLNFTNCGVAYINGCWNMHVVGSSFGNYIDTWLQCGKYPGEWNATDATNVNEVSIRESMAFSTGLISTRKPITHNALGLAYLRDIPSTNGFVTAAVTNAVAAEVRTKANAADVYTKTEVYTQTEIDDEFLKKNYMLSWDGNTLESYGLVLFYDSIGIVNGWGKISAAGITLPDYLASTAWHGSNKSLTDYGITNSIPSTNGFITATVATNAAEAVVGEVLEYALTNVTGTAISLVSGEIGNATIMANTSVTLYFSSDANKSGDCMLYAINETDTDYTISPQPTAQYTFVSADLAKALTIGKATTNVLSFTRLNANTVLVGKLEVK